MFDALPHLFLGAFLLFFGIYLSAAFSGLRMTMRNFWILAILFAACGIVQILIILFYSFDMIEKLYPLIVHVPLVLFLRSVYHKNYITCIASVTAAYLFCQPANWFGMVIYTFTENHIAELIVRITCIILTFVIFMLFVAKPISEIFNNGRFRVLIFGMIPILYYIYDYTVTIYTNLNESYWELVTEFLPFFVCIMFIIFCIVYHRVYEQKSDLERTQQILRITTEHQQKDMEQIKASRSEIRLLRHDMRLLLNNLLICIENDEKEKSREMIASYTSLINETKLHYYCAIDSINYAISAYISRFEAMQIQFSHKIELAELNVDDTLFISILSNALDNALNAQEFIPENERYIKLMMKTVDDKLLLSVKNPTHQKVIFSDGLPVTEKKGHGYGTQSIRYMTERLGGNCQFSEQDRIFTLRVII